MPSTVVTNLDNIVSAFDTRDDVVYWPFPARLFVLPVLIRILGLRVKE